MSCTIRSGRPLPRARIDPIADEATALTVIRTAMAVPRRPETIVMFLDRRWRGLSLTVVSGSNEPDDVLTIAERLLDPVAVRGRAAAVVIASVRRRRTARLDDLDRWLELDAIATERDIELVEWFVVGDGVSRPRELQGAPPRW